MTIDPAVLIGFVAALLSLVGYIVRLFLTGALLTPNVVSRADFDAVQADKAMLLAAIPALTEAINKAMATADVLRKNGNGNGAK